MNLFRVRGIQLAAHFSFFLLLAYFAHDGWQQGQWIGMLWSVATLLACFTCVVLHEFGHSFTAMHFGIGVRRILLMPIGGMAEFDAIPRAPSRELLITVAGPAVNFALAGALWALAGGPAEGWLNESSYTADATGFMRLLLAWNLMMGCFNLAPVFPMDGGRIFRALLATRLPYLRATFIAATVGKVLSVAGAISAIYFFGAPLTALLFAFIFFAGEMEYRAVLRRELEDARWRQIMAEWCGETATPKEPPLLSG